MYSEFHISMLANKLGADWPQPDDLITSWAQYKAFASHGEKFNMSPVDVTGPNTSEPVKVTHDGPGTHAAGGGGDGGGVLGTGRNGDDQSGDVPSQRRESDVVDGKPRDTLHGLTTSALGRQPSAQHHHIRDDISNAGSDIVDTVNQAAVFTTGGGNPTFATGGPGGSGGGNAPGATNIGANKSKEPSSPNPSSGFSTGSGTGGGGRGGDENKKPSGPNEGFQDWEKEEMEGLLGEIRGHLGESCLEIGSIRGISAGRYGQEGADTIVIYPTRFLEAEDAAHNFLFNVSLSPSFTHVTGGRKQADSLGSPTRSCPFLSSTSIITFSLPSSSPNH